jgi:hypothetical protein
VDFENISMRFCFILLVTGLLHAADPPRESRRITSVVRTDPRTGKLVRSVIVSPRTLSERQVAAKVVPSHVIDPTEPPAIENSRAPATLDAAVEQVAARYSLTPELLRSVIKVESNYDPYAVSPKGAQGLMQLIPETARRFGVGNAFNPMENLEGGARYLRYLVDLYSGANGETNWPLVLAAYNAGEGAVAKYGGVPPYRETQNYLTLVKKHLDESKRTRPATPHAPANPAPPRAKDEPAHIQEIVETDGTVRYVSR